MCTVNTLNKLIAKDMLAEALTDIKQQTFKNEFKLKTVRNKEANQKHTKMPLHHLLKNLCKHN